MSDRANKVRRSSLKYRLDRKHDITGVSHMPKNMTAPMTVQTSPVQIIGGYELMALIVHQTEQIALLEEARQNLWGVFYGRKEEGGSHE